MKKLLALSLILLACSGFSQANPVPVADMVKKIQKNRFSAGNMFEKIRLIVKNELDVSVSTISRMVPNSARTIVPGGSVELYLVTQDWFDSTAISANTSRRISYLDSKSGRGCVINNPPMNSILTTLHDNVECELALSFDEDNDAYLTMLIRSVQY